MNADTGSDKNTWGHKTDIRRETLRGASELGKHALCDKKRTTRLSPEEDSPRTSTQAREEAAHVLSISAAGGRPLH